jgi:hypothetical protein
VEAADRTETLKGITMVLHVRKAFLTDGPNWASEGPGRFSIPEGGVLYDVSEADRFGFRDFTYEGQRMKAHKNLLFANAEEPISETSGQEQMDIGSIRRSSEMVHVEDSGALSAFNEGRMLFDVTLHGRKLEEFIQKNGLERYIRRTSDGELQWIAMLVNDRPVYIAQKKS